MINMRAVTGLGNVEADLQARMTTALMRAQRYVDPPTSDRVISQLVTRASTTQTYREGVAGPRCQELVNAIPDIDEATRTALYQTCLGDPAGFQAQVQTAYPPPFYKSTAFKVGVGGLGVIAVVGGLLLALR